MKNLIVISLIITICSSCDPCDECGMPLVFDPTVELVFINNDTLQGLDKEIASVTETLSTQELKEADAEDKLDSLENRLIEVNELIENGDNSYEEERDDLEDLIIDYTDSLDYYALIIHELDSIQDHWVDFRQEVRDGLIKVDTLYVNNQYITYDDSAKSYHAPLLMTEEAFTQFETVIGKYRGEISFEYILEESVDETREIKLRARDITPHDYHQYDSISEPQCVTSECRDHETTVYIYL